MVDFILDFKKRKKIFGKSNFTNTLKGSSGDDWIEGYNLADSLIGNDGDDLINGGDGNDTIIGGDGSDDLYGGNGNDSIIGGKGNDQNPGWSWLTVIDKLFGGEGDDTVIGSYGSDELYGGNGNDSIIGGEGNDTISGSDGDDTIIGGYGSDNLDGGSGNDTYFIDNVNQRVNDSSGIDTAYVSTNFAKIPSSIENVVYTNGAQALPYWIDALLPNGAAGNNYAALLGKQKTFQYIFPTKIPTYYETDADSFKDSAGWTAFTSTQQKRVEDALDYITAVIDLSFVKNTNPNSLNTIVFSNNTQNESAGYTYRPNASFFGSDIFLDNSVDSSSNESLAEGTYAAYVLIHELGHALGLKHPFSAEDADEGLPEPPYLPATEESTAWTVMSYNDSPAQYYFQYSPLDLAALHYLYGPSKTARVGNDSYDVSQTNCNFIWDGGGIDTLDASKCSVAANLYLEPGYWGYVRSKANTITSAGQVTVNFGSSIENLIGTAFNDFLYGTSKDNSISGGNGDDAIYGLGGNDFLDGGSGEDTVYFNLPSTEVNFVELDSTIFAISTSFTSKLLNFESIQFSDKKISIPDLTFNPNTPVTLSGTNLSEGMRGLNGNDSLTGYGGDDTLDGGAGNDTLVGGTGNDSYYIDNSSDKIIENKLEGIDTVFATINAASYSSYSIPENVENLSVFYSDTRSKTFYASGNFLDNVMIGSSGINYFFASIGNDTIEGGRSGDYLVGYDGSDTFRFSPGDSGQSKESVDYISDFAKGILGDVIDFSAIMVVGGNDSAATENQASINTQNGIATFRKNSGKTLSDAMSDIAERFSVEADIAGEFAFFRLANKGNYFLFISDGEMGVTENDVVIELAGIKKIASVSLNDGNLSITT